MWHRIKKHKMQNKQGHKKKNITRALKIRDFRRANVTSHSLGEPIDNFTQFSLCVDPFQYPVLSLASAGIRSSAGLTSVTFEQHRRSIICKRIVITLRSRFAPSVFKMEKFLFRITAAAQSNAAGVLVHSVTLTTWQLFASHPTFSWLGTHTHTHIHATMIQHFSLYQLYQPHQFNRHWTASNYEALCPDMKLQEHHIWTGAGAKSVHEHQLTANSSFHYDLVV